jgi:hypothetical protein
LLRLWLTTLRLGLLTRPIRLLLLSLRRLGGLLTRVLTAHIEWLSVVISGGVLLAPASPEIRQGNEQTALFNTLSVAAAGDRPADRGSPKVSLSTLGRRIKKGNTASIGFADATDPWIPNG